MTKKELILASTSKYRKELLSRLAYKFTTSAPLIDEESEKDPSLSPQKLCEHLAFLKAQSLKGPGKVVIGSDQLVCFEGHILGKPHSEENAVKQLLSLQGKTHELITAVTVFDEDRFESFTDITLLSMKKLSEEQIRAYIQLDHPLDCAGAYKIELHGIKLFDQIQSQDFTAIQGLPLLQLHKILENLNL